jgi:hypothetical protein
LFTINNYPGNKYFGYMEQLDSGGTGSYHGLGLAVTKRLSRGLLVNTNYTWSHCISDLSIGDSTGNAGAGMLIPGNRRYDRSNCQSNEIGGTFSSDRRHIFNTTVVYEVQPEHGVIGLETLGDFPDDLGLSGDSRSAERRLVDHGIRRHPAPAPGATGSALPQPWSGAELLDQSGGLQNSRFGHTQPDGTQQHPRSSVVDV